MFKLIIKILGTGCKKCKTLEENARQAAEELGVAAEFTKVTNLNDISAYVMFTPALVIDEAVKVEGKVATVEQIKEMLQAKL